MEENNQQPQAESQPVVQPVQGMAPQVAQPMPASTEQFTAPSSAMPLQPQMASAPVQATPIASDPGHGLGVASLILAFIFPLVGLILGIIAKSKSKSVGKSNGLALAGIIISILGMVTGLIVGGILVAAGLSVAAKCKDLGPGTHNDNGTTITCS